MAKKKKANNLAFRLAALLQWLAHHSVVSGCYLADPWMCVCEGVVEEARCPRNLICGAGPVGGIDHWRWNAFVLTKTGLFKYANAVFPGHRCRCPCRAGQRQGGEVSLGCLTSTLPVAVFSALLLGPGLPALRCPPILSSEHATVATCALWNCLLIHRNLSIHDAKWFLSLLQVTLFLWK